MPHQELPYWHFNVPPAERTAACPDYLRDLTDKDRGLIGMWDDEFEPVSWAEARDIIRTETPSQYRI